MYQSHGATDIFLEALVGSDFVAAQQAGGSTSTRGDEPDLDTRERLVRAAIEVFLEKGYGGTRVQDIARRAGFTSGALYVHFQSRTALLGEAIIREGQNIMLEMAETFGAVAAGDAAASMKFAEFSAGPPSNLDLLLLEALALASRSDDAKDVLAGALGAFVDMLMAQIDERRATGGLDSSLDVDALRQVFVSWVFGSVVVKALRMNSGVSPEALATINSRLLSGLTPPA